MAIAAPTVSTTAANAVTNRAIVSRRLMAHSSSTDSASLASIACSSNDRFERTWLNARRPLPAAMSARAASTPPLRTSLINGSAMSWSHCRQDSDVCSSSGNRSAPSPVSSLRNSASA